DPDVQISLEEVMEAGRGDIGSKAPKEIPPDKQPGALGSLGTKAAIAGLGAAAGVAGAIGGAVSAVGKMVGGIGSALGGLGGLVGLGGLGSGAGAGGAPGAGARSPGRGFLDAFKDWASAIAERMSETLENARNRELNRLMRMLDDDPENGLSYAIPIGGKA